MTTETKIDERPAAEPTAPGPKRGRFSWCRAIESDMRGHNFLIDETKHKKRKTCQVCGLDNARLYAMEWDATCKNWGDQRAWLCSFCAHLLVASAKWDGMRRFRFDHFGEELLDLWQAVDLLIEISDGQLPRDTAPEQLNKSS